MRTSAFSRASAFCFLTALALAVLGCGPENVIRLTIVGDATIDDALRARVTALTLTVSGAHNKQTSYAVGGLRPEERIELVPIVTSGELTIVAEATDARPTVIAAGSIVAHVTGDRVASTLTLSVRAPNDLSIDPPSTTVTRGRAFPFTATGPVTWSIVDANGGAIDANGLYTAPDRPGGPYRIRAASTTDDGVAYATVSVVDYGLEVVAGVLGGRGFSDGAGGAARFVELRAMTGDSATMFVVDESTLRRIDVPTPPAQPVVTTLIDGRYTTEVPTMSAPFASAAIGPVTSLSLDATNQLLYLCDTGVLRIADLRQQTITAPLAQTCTAVVFDSGFNGSSPSLYVYSSGAIINHPISGLQSGMAGRKVAGERSAYGYADGPNSSARFASGVWALALAFNPGATNRQLYVADTRNNAIRVVEDSAGGATSTVVGNGTAGYRDGAGPQAQLNGPRGLARAGSVLRIIDTGNRLVRSFDPGANLVSTVAGTPYTPSTDGRYSWSPSLDGARASFYLPSAVLGDYVADSMTLRRIGSGAMITTVAGEPTHIDLIDAAGGDARGVFTSSVVSDGRRVFVTDSIGAVLRQIDLDQRTVTTIAGKKLYSGFKDGSGDAAQLRSPLNTALWMNTLYVIDGTTLRSVDLQTHEVVTLAGADGSSSVIDGVGTAARLANPNALATDGALILFGDGCRLRKYTIATRAVETLTGPVSCTFVPSDGTGTAAELGYAAAIAYEAGQWFVADVTAVRLIDVSARALTTVAGSLVGGSPSGDGVGSAARFSRVTGLLGSGSRRLYVVDGGSLRTIDVDTREVKTLFGRPLVSKVILGPLDSAQLNNVTGMALTRSGDILLTDAYEGILFRARVPK